MPKIKYKVGDVVMIPINNDRFAFGRLLQDSSIAVYAFTSNTVPEMSELEAKEILLEAGIFDTNIVNGEWKIIGYIPFGDANDSWPSPKFIRDVIDPNQFRIYFKGEMTPASRRDVEGLEKQVMCRPDELVQKVVERLAMGMTAN